jgi:curved DNA-binding protein CbpA
VFIDYYAVLEIEVTASQQEVKAAFRARALKWHPDRNRDQDTNLIMQKINEAYLILKDPEARGRYDREYERFKRYQQECDYSNKKSSEGPASNQEYKERKDNDYRGRYDYADYSINDDILKKWIENARRQAVDLARKTIEDFKGISNVGAKAVSQEIVAGIGRYIVYGVGITLIFEVIKSCNGH